ncbi:MAG: hypothetical protein K2K67_10840, partial [Treponemataceae bacterium]|nr:hypothetical protein [Treponemataceae bacterium]
VQENGDGSGGSSGTGGTSGGSGNDKTPGSDTSTPGGVVSRPIEIQASGSLSAKGGGWLESAWIEWSPVSSDINDTYNVSVRKAGGEWVKIDKELIRGYGNSAESTTVTKFRADALGLAEGSYDMKVELASDPTQSAEISGVSVLAHDRSGFAFKGDYLPGAYKADGTLKDGAVVVYVDNDNFNSVKVTTKDSKGKEVEFVGVQTLVDTSGCWKSSSAPLCIRIIGKIDTTGFPKGSWGSKAEGLQVKCSKENQDMNVTIEGVGEDATLHGFGILCRTTKGVEIRKLGLMVFADDGISLDTDNLNTWVHNLDIFYGGTGSDSDQAKGDGSLDVKGDSKNQTYSYIHFWDSGKMSLCGMKSETGPNYITYHHNWFDHSDSRHPRVRTMTVHVYNNYYDGNAKYGAGATTDSDVFVENNYFRNCKFPMLTAGQGNDVYAGTKDYKPNDYGTFSGETGGAIKSWNNKIVDTINITSYWPYGATEMLTKGKNVTSSSLGIDTTKHFDAWEAKSREEKVPSTVVAFDGGAQYSNFDTDSSIMYTYRVDTPDDAKTNVENFAGRMRKGAIDTADFYFDLSNYTPTIDSKHNATNPDEDYNIIKTLKEDLIAYKSKLVTTNVTANSTTGGGTTGGDGDGDGDNTGNTGGSGTTTPGTGTAGGTTTETDGSKTYTFAVSSKALSFDNVTTTMANSGGTAQSNYWKLTKNSGAFIAMTVKNLAVGQTVKITVTEGNSKSGDPYTLTTENLTESNGSYTVTANGDITIKVAENGTKDYYFGTVVVNVK